MDTAIAIRTAIFTATVDLNIPASFTKAYWHHLVFDPRWAMWVLAGTSQLSRNYFGSLKHDWILKVAQPTREHMKRGVAQYICYYNNDRLHTANGDLSPAKYELSQLKVSGIG